MTRAATEVDHEAFDALVIPGGWAPDKLRRYPAVTDLVAGVRAAGKPIAVVCHGGLVAISAKIVDGMRATGSKGIKDDLVNAGATWVDEPAFREGIAWGRVVEDIPAFLRETVENISPSITPAIAEAAAGRSRSRGRRAAEAVRGRGRSAAEPDPRRGRPGPARSAAEPDPRPSPTGEPGARFPRFWPGERYVRWRGLAAGPARLEPRRSALAEHG